MIDSYRLGFIERAISLISPEWALKRTRARMTMDYIRSYDGAKYGKRTKHWRATSGSANLEIYNSLVILRNRSRDLTRNNPFAKRAIEIISTNTVGSGIRPSISGTGKNDVKRVMKAWKSWAETTECDFDGNFTFYGLQELIMRSVADAGDVLIRIRRVSGGTVPIKLQVVEGDLLDHTRNYAYGINETGSGQNKDGYTIQGVEFDKDGNKVAYWLYDRHPNEMITTSISSKRVPATDVIHIFKCDRPGQVRGVPFGVSAMLKLRDFDEYDDAQLVRQKIAACFSTFIETGTTSLVDTVAGTKKDSYGNLIERVEPGIIQRLEPGQKITFATPPGVEGYGEYSKGQLRAVAAGYGVTYEAMTGDLSNVNFSSGRMGWLEFHRLLASWQNNIMISMCCQKVFSVFIDACKIAMIINKTDIRADWTAPRREMIDPVKEVKGISEEIRAGITSWSDAVRSQGYNPDELMDQINKDFEEMNKLNLMLSCNPKYDANRPPVELGIDPASDGNRKPQKE